ncbi:hypothetical protein [Bifidobacterium oedipodis]|uniref:Uncharacterized protein n=1 Tax=Bifidobacterium oedipodis TaxID=2675322 RepID=A0A7Y0HT95_9BIFI|nr:hypothetical protein [Bifidobacterium sp. DSM 109957]NMM93887.1 hypothetical protein [Bifidobacterium sp. DSM 109957]
MVPRHSRVERRRRRNGRIAVMVLIVAAFLFAWSGVVGPVDYCKATVMDGSSPFTSVAQCRAYYESEV